MSFLAPALDFAKAEEEVCDKWAKEDTFKTQNKLSEERGDEVRLQTLYVWELEGCNVWLFDSKNVVEIRENL